MSEPNDPTSTDYIGPLSSTFLEFCAKLRSNDPSILPKPGKPLIILPLSEQEVIELADALLENTNVTSLKLGTEKYTKISAEAMAKYVRTSKHLQRIDWKEDVVRQREEVRCGFLAAIQESTSLKEVHMEFSFIDGSSNLALENMLTHTQSLRSLTLTFPVGGLLEETALAEVSSGLRKNTTLRELTLEMSEDALTISPLLTSVRDHPLLQRLCLHGYVDNLTGLETLLLSGTSKITELEIHRSFGGPRIVDLTPVLQALARRPTLAKLALHQVRLNRDEARLLRMALCNIPSLQSLVLIRNTLGSVGLAKLAPALYRNTSIKELDLSWNDLNDMDSAAMLRDILRHNKTMTAIDLSENLFGLTAGAVDCIADALGSNSILLKINLSNCCLRDGGVSTLAQTLGSWNTTLHKLILCWNAITSTGICVLLEAMEQSHHITDLDLQGNPIRNEGASLLARSLGDNALSNLTHLVLRYCGIGDDGFITLVSALEQNTSLLHLDLPVPSFQ
jgi:hypothetical protein